MIRVAGDTHTHTIACQHAYSTIDENARYAAEIGLKFLVTTEHGPDMPCGPHIWFHHNLPRCLPRELHGVVMLSGCEADVTEDGGLDIDEPTLAKLEWVIASMHKEVMPRGKSADYYTETWLKIAENPYVDCIGHIGQVLFPCDYDLIAKTMAEKDKVIEINSGSFMARKGSEVNCLKVIKACKKYGTKIVLSSDAHFYNRIGDTENSWPLVVESGYPEEDILNLDYERFAKFIFKKKNIRLPRVNYND